MAAATVFFYSTVQLDPFEGWKRKHVHVIGRNVFGVNAVVTSVDIDIVRGTVLRAGVDGTKPGQLGGNIASGVLDVPAIKSQQIYQLNSRKGEPKGLNEDSSTICSQRRRTQTHFP